MAEYPKRGVSPWDQKLKAYIDAGDTAASESDYHLTGTGFPGSLGAPVGATYIDSDATNGAVRWVMTPDGWAVEYGDTGWRQILSWTDGVQNAANQTGTVDSDHFTLEGTSWLRVRRLSPGIIRVATGHSAENGIRLLSTGQVFALLADADWPSGFRMDLKNSGWNATFNVAARGRPVLWGRETGNGSDGLGVPTGATNTLVVGLAAEIWTDTDPWPTTLPGIPA